METRGTWEWTAACASNGRRGVVEVSSKRSACAAATRPFARGVRDVPTTHRGARQSATPRKSQSRRPKFRRVYCTRWPRWVTARRRGLHSFWGVPPAAAAAGPMAGGDACAAAHAHGGADVSNRDTLVTKKQRQAIVEGHQRVERVLPCCRGRCLPRRNVPWSWLPPATPTPALWP